ncbi:CRISPR system precrRNA processing endoribonuclease RAMP protein Cas6 [Geobacter sp. AOG2]|uniref:CRISPR system precrRNA processing endoribonuclease RAMP protein Cas6 n=1 Tax=Geobacter sp. AOG2 TaxID=1566347 RepID=UPI001CC44D47|nr:CRISPR system precrRNA processing endoribonuclease RAMP protein Cas6 [Geobacter sp. AOG2]GFE61023.1 hypothetical protein AOG2_16100 [Geobacter sp. AOG2]
MDFSFVHLRFTIRTRDTSRLVSYLYRSGPDFAEVFRRIVCRRNATECSDDPSCTDCPRRVLFGQQLGADPSAVKCHQKPPLPFIFSFPTHGTTSKQADSFTCTLVLVGKALNHTTEFIKALSSLLINGCQVGQFAEATISLVESLDFYGNPTTIAVGVVAPDTGNLVTLDAQGIVDSRCRPTDTVGIAFITPLKLAKTGKIMCSFDAGQFLRSLMRRVSALAYYYCSYEMRDNFREYAYAANRIELLEDNFFFADAGHRSLALSGVLGNGVMSGDFNDLMPFLALGEYLHLGKGASYGMGQYRLSW